MGIETVAQIWSPQLLAGSRLIHLAHGLQNSTRDIWGELLARVEAGDTPLTICIRIYANLSMTATLNRLENPSLIHVGDILFIPGPGRLMAVSFLLLKNLNDNPCYGSVNASSFSFESFGPESCSSEGELICMGSAIVDNGILNITPQLEERNEVGRILYRHPVTVWPAMISTTFTVRISKYPNSTSSGDGMAFIIAQDNHPSPENSYGLFMGILNRTTQGLKQLAVELDTFMNEFDIDDNHIAIDTNSIIRPVAMKSLNSTGIDLKSGQKIKIRIDYDGWNKYLRIYVAYLGGPFIGFLNQSIKMSDTVPSSVYVGFTGSTGTVSESHEVFDWNFTSTPLPDYSLRYKPQKGNKIKAILLIMTLVVLGLLLIVTCTVPCIRRWCTRRNEKHKSKGDIESLTKSACNAPNMFTYKQLSKATSNFSKDNLLGTGGFGSVYKGILAEPSATIAVKKFSATSLQGEREYLAEICTIGRLRHKNLVQLKGWCHESEHLLLVYDYMANASLDRFIGKQCLVWNIRYKILTGLASALLYLHEECGNPMVHRDVKPNNVMLDSDFDAHLGDFGLARLLQNEASVTTRVAGTPGYVAPEVSFTGKATPESDVYSFGMVVLEVVCGKRSRTFSDDDSMVDHVWNLHEKNALLECVDKMLEQNFDEEQARRCLLVGLACLHPDSKHRPRMRKVVQIFMNLNEPLMDLPDSRPKSVHLSLGCSSVSTTIGFGSGSSSTPTGFGSSTSNSTTL
ncbi:Protein kinase domain [Dillenia turbinata]|uniref:non-specific serine/threonine protein kinase n=1 Tax=Dillenia turbinata TaxID=194707 RepID=A0AAN8V319_9MAGN